MFTKLIVIISLLQAMLFASNPYKNIVEYKLDNGLQVMLHASKEAKQVELLIEVDVGVQVETKENLGVSHLLEHMIFRHEKLKKNETYLQILQEAGAKANGTTSWLKTRYFASIEASKAFWLLDTFATMMVDRNMTRTGLEKEKQTVILEIGEVSWLMRTLGINLGEFFNSDVFAEKDIFEEVFGLNEHFYARDTERANNAKLTVEQLQKHYDDYYYPSNMRLEIAGNFDIKQMQERIEKTFGKAKKRSGKTVKTFHAKLPLQTYYKVPKGRLTNQPFIAKGVVFNDIDAKDKMILSAYIEYIAKEFMKTLRNGSGEAYTISPVGDSTYGMGYLGIEFITTKASFEKNHKYVNEHFYDVASLSDKQIESLMNNFEDTYFKGVENSAKSLLQRINSLVRYRKKLDSGDAYQDFKSLNVDEVRERLSKLFHPSKRYSEIHTSFLFFEYDIYFLDLIVTILLIIYMRRKFMKRINKREMLFSEALFSRGAYALWMTFFVISALFVYVLIELALIRPLFVLIGMERMLVLWPYYLISPLFDSLILIYMFFLLGLTKSELIVTKTSLVLLSARTLEIAIDDVKSISVVSYKTGLDLPSIISLKSRRFGFRWNPFLDKVQIKTYEGYTYILSMDQAKECVDELQTVCFKQED
jgi:predicted Zn-dependent peptidase